MFLVTPPPSHSKRGVQLHVRREGMRLFSPSVLCSGEQAFNKEKARGKGERERPERSHSWFGHCGGRNTISIDGIDGEAPQKRKKGGPFSAAGEPYKTMGDGC